jgi:hypothetical protein
MSETFSTANNTGSGESKVKVSSENFLKTPASRYSFARGKINQPKGKSTLKERLERGHSVTGILNVDKLEKIVERAIKFLETSHDNAGAIVRGIIAFAVLIYGSPRAFEDMTADKQIDFDLDTGLATVSAVDFLTYCWEAPIETIEIRAFTRAYPNVVSAELNESAEILAERFRITSPFVTFSSLFPRGFGENDKFRSGEIQNKLKDLDLEAEREYRA